MVGTHESVEPQWGELVVARIEEMAQAVAHQIQTEHRERDGVAGKKRQPRLLKLLTFFGRGDERGKMQKPS